MKVTAGCPIRKLLSGKTQNEIFLRGRKQETANFKFAYLHADEEFQINLT